MTLKLFVFVQRYYMPSYIVLGPMISELHAMRMICLLREATPAWVRNMVSFTL